MNHALTQLQILHKKWWFSHQSEKTCKLGSDGVGHDFIHDADKLQAACRNAFAAYHELENVTEEIEIKKIDHSEYDAEDPRDQIFKRRCLRIISQLEMRKAEMELALTTYMNHVLELLPKVSNRYQSYDDALKDIWQARVAYNALVKNHPLGQELKVALLEEADKAELIGKMGFPTQIPGPDGNLKPLPVPNALTVQDALSDKKSELNHA